MFFNLMRVNIIKRSAFHALVVFYLLATFSAVAQQMHRHDDRNELPEIGVVASAAISLDKEQEIGDIIMRQMHGQLPIVNDPVLEQYLQDLGNRLVANADNVKFPFSFFWVNNGAINAFAFFGGHIGVHTGLIHYANDESELASVLAHEIAHVTQRHIARRIQAQQRATPLMLASMLAGIAVAVANPEAGMAAVSATQATSAQMQIDYTRSNEQEADQIGISTLYKAGYDVSAAASFFSILNEQYRTASKPPERLLTHPLTENRIADARARISDYPERKLAPNLSFHLAKARVMARYTFSEKFSVEYFQQALDKKQYVFEQAALYGLAIAQHRVGNITAAQQLINRLLTNDPTNYFYVDLASDLYIESDQPQQATALLSPLLEQAPRNKVLVLNQANALIHAQQESVAVELLKDFLLVDDDYLLAYSLLSDAYKEQQNALAMHQTKAEVFALTGAYQRAVDELQYAYNYTGDDHLTKQRIRARIKQLRSDIERLKSL